MARSRFTCAPFAAILFTWMLFAQTPPKIEFARDVQPLLRQNCVGCHGPAVQQAGLRLDRKSSVMKSFSRRVVPGSSQNSFIYHRLIGSEYGPQMPPTGALTGEQIATVKAWIDQGADWPDSLANEADLPPVDPKALSTVDALRRGNLVAFMNAVTANPDLLNARGPEGSTPFLYAVLYSGPETIDKLLKLGADVNKLNDANASALMWAATNFEKTQLLVNHGADVNAKSTNLRTPLMIAARRPGSARIVKLLLDHKADPNPNPRPQSDSSPLLEAITAGDAATVELLIERGADARATGQIGLTMSVTTECRKCFELLARQTKEKNVFTGALQDTAALGDIKSARFLIEHGADVKAFDPLGRTALMYAAISDLLPLDVVKLLIKRGADVNAVNKHTKAGDAGLSVLDIAMLNGDTPVSRALVSAGAKARTPVAAVLKPRRENEIRTAVQDSIPLLQRSDAGFAAKSGCISCHNNSLAAMTIGLVRKHGFRVDEEVASEQVRVNVKLLEKQRDAMRQGAVFQVGDNFSDHIFSYMLLGLHAENYKPDINTDAAVLYILARQNPDGQWLSPKADTRPPIGLNHIGQTALNMRALQIYTPAGGEVVFEKSIQLAASWLAKTKPLGNSDRSWRLAGLAWAGTEKAAMRTALQELLAEQRPDGGWSDMPSMKSTSYATGKSLVALRLGGLATTNAAYQRGVRFLLSTQQEDGSWHVKTRALAFQPYFEAGFPHGYDQWVSAAGTSWAAMALTLTQPEARAETASRGR